MAISILVIGKTIKSMESENIRGKMVEDTMVNGLKANNRG
jgi:hypothetical protein